MRPPSIFKTLITFLLITSLIACKKEDPVDPSADLHLDGTNFSAPILDPDTYTMAVLFTENDLQAFVGKEIEEILVYIDNIPNQCNVMLFKDGSNNQPGEQLYNSNVTDELEADSWNFHSLASTVAISGEPIWVAIEVTQNNAIATVGCDAGPAVSNGDYIFSKTDNTWETLRNRSEDEVDINWNIRLRISE